MVTGTEPVATATSTRQVDDNVYIRVPREKVAPVNTERTQTVQQHVSQSSAPSNATPVLQSAPVQLPAPAAKQWRGDLRTILYARASVSHPGGSGDTNVYTVDTEPLLEALTQRVARRLAVPGAASWILARRLLQRRRSW